MSRPRAAGTLTQASDARNDAPPTVNLQERVAVRARWCYLGHARPTTTLNIYAKQFAEREGEGLGELIGEAFAASS